MGCRRQSDPHSHAVILDPFFGRIAFVPDLGMDLIRQFHYDPEAIDPESVLYIICDIFRAITKCYYNIYIYM